MYILIILKERKYNFYPPHWVSWIIHAWSRTRLTQGVSQSLRFISHKILYLATTQCSRDSHIHHLNLELLHLGIQLDGWSLGLDKLLFEYEVKLSLVPWFLGFISIQWSHCKNFMHENLSINFKHPHSLAEPLNLKFMCWIF